MESNATLKVVRTRVKYVLMYSKTDNAILRSLPWTEVANFISKGTGRNSSVGSAWARCPLGTFSVEGIFPLELTWVQTPFPQKLLRMRV